MILAYHRVNPWYPEDALSVTPEALRRQAAFLLRRRRAAGLDEYAAAADRRGIFAVTFDDGYADNLWFALPVLREMGVPFTVFLTAGAAGTDRLLPRYRDPARDRFLTWEEAREMAAAGVSFGSHGMTHARLTRLPPGAMRREIAESARLIGERLGRDPSFFCYPYGDWNAAAAEAAAAAGYRGAVVTGGGRGGEPAFRMRRVGVYGHNGMLAFAVKTWKESLCAGRS